MERLLAVNEALERVVGRVAAAAGWLFAVLAAVVVFDVVTRKAGYQVPGFGSTRLQELEWHLHAALFSFWIGYAYLRNAHVRIDLLSGRGRLRTQAWIELAGCAVVALPFCAIAFAYCLDYAWIAWLHGEASESLSGLPYRFVPKGILALGLLLMLLAVLSVAVRTAIYLWGPEALQGRSGFAGITRRGGT